MKTSLKKLVAGASIVALAAMNIAFTNAAPSTAVVTAWNIVITDARFEAGQDVNNLTVYVDWVLSPVWELTITEDTLTIDNTTDYVWAEKVQYIYETGTPATNFVWAVVVKGSASHQVVVSATVLPYLNMSITNTAIDFGALNLWVLNTALSTTPITVSSNAQEWFNVAASYAQLTHTDNTTTIPFVLNNGAADIATTWNIINQVWYVWTDVNATVSYKATPASNQKSGNYSTIVTYSVTWNF